MAQENYYMSFDPGKATGWATFDETGNVTGNGIYQGNDVLIEALWDVLGQVEMPKVFIYEDFTLFQNRALQQSGSNMPACIAIGAIRMAIAACKAEEIKQPSSILPIALKWAGIKWPKGKHLDDDKSAYVHGVYHLIKSGVRKIEV